MEIDNLRINHRDHPVVVYLVDCHARVLYADVVVFTQRVRHSLLLFFFL